MTIRKPTISDLAQAAGVSKTTVSHAFSGRRHVDPETRKRIEFIAQEMGYRPSRAAQHLRTGRTGVIALASSMPFAVAAGPSRLGFLMDIAASAAVASLTRNMALCLVPPLGDDAHLDALSPDGAILVEPFEDDPLVRHFAEAHVPIVTIGRVPGRDDLPHVDIGSGATARLVMDHLQAEGARRPALVIGTQPRTSYAETRAVFSETCGSLGVPDVQSRSTRQAARRWPRPRSPISCRPTPRSTRSSCRSTPSPPARSVPRPALAAPCPATSRSRRATTGCAPSSRNRR